ncbi:hypothetical protein B0O99DRAFT_506524 [Bisporella sp. PMI_857]|nr:hypothetical protein B0O99DRAFT_506524 [Bisporella sp. PMI_857]
MTSFHPWRHIPPLLIGTGQGLGGLMPFWNPARAIGEFGLPPRIQSSQPAQQTFTIYAARSSIIGAAIWISYFRGRFRTVDLLMALNAYGAAVDAYICFTEGEVGRAWFRGLMGVFVGAWGLLGITSGGS